LYRTKELGVEVIDNKHVIILNGG